MQFGLNLQKKKVTAKAMPVRRANAFGDESEEEEEEEQVQDPRGKKKNQKAKD
ncbi:unnamed protein product [Mucor hiemalis]